MTLLVQLLYRLCFGLAAAMALVPPRLVTSGYYRNHLYVLLGGQVLAGLIAWSAPEGLPWGPAAAGAALSYIGSVIWLYERPAAGRVALLLVAASGLWGALATVSPTSGTIETPRAAHLLAYAAPVTGGLVVGSTLAAMFLGHWYLNAPTMKIAPLRRLVAVMATTVAAQAVVSGVALALEWAHRSGGLDFATWMFLGLRWLAGIAGTLALCAMTWQTLKIPNTQAATGMLYVAVITTLTGELAGQLLSNSAVFPL